MATLKPAEGSGPNNNVPMAAYASGGEPEKYKNIFQRNKNTVYTVTAVASAIIITLGVVSTITPGVTIGLLAGVVILVFTITETDFFNDPENVKALFNVIILALKNVNSAKQLQIEQEKTRRAELEKRIYDDLESVNLNGYRGDVIVKEIKVEIERIKVSLETNNNVTYQGFSAGIVSYINRRVAPVVTTTTTTITTTTIITDLSDQDRQLLEAIALKFKYSGSRPLN